MWLILTKKLKGDGCIMLKNVPAILSPELIKVLMEMGHGDEIVIADGNFPCYTHNNNVIRMDGNNGNDVLEAIISLMPLDSYSDTNVTLMSVVEGDDVRTPIWEDYNKTLNLYEGDSARIGFLDRFAFYEQTKHAYAVVATSEEALYANIILKKGVIK
jgi:L-fucose mutarotase